jgi:DNA replication protein DnaC
VAVHLGAVENPPLRSNLREPLERCRPLTFRENSRIKTVLRIRRSATIKTLADFAFTLQPSLDRDRIFTFGQLGFVDWREAVHFLGPPGRGKSHLAIAVGVEAVKSGKSVYFCTLAV